MRIMCLREASTTRHPISDLTWGFLCDFYVCRYLPRIDEVSASSAALTTPFHFLHGDRDLVAPLPWMRASAQKCQELGIASVSIGIAAFACGRMLACKESDALLGCSAALPAGLT